MNSHATNTTRTDPFSQVLHSWSPPNWFAGLAELNSPWGLSVPEGLASLFVVLAGRCVLTLGELGNGDALESGDVLLLPQGSTHRLQDKPTSPTTPLGAGFGRRCRHLPSTHEAVPMTKLIYGCFSVASHGFQTLTDGFPPVVRLKVESCQSLRGCRALSEVVASEQSMAAPGCREIVDQLVQVVLFQTMRAFLLEDSLASHAECSDDGVPWLSAALDEAIGPALALIHRQPGEPWTVTSLASRVNMSKSAFSERFRDTVGKPPLHYLTEYRIQRACRLLRDTELGVKEIASHVGYESASSFSNAFKRWTGKAPGAFRRNGQPEVRSSVAIDQQGM